MRPWKWIRESGPERAIVLTAALGWGISRALGSVPSMAAFGLVLALLGPGLAAGRILQVLTSDWTRNLLVGGALSAPLLGLVGMLSGWNRGAVDGLTLPALGLSAVVLLWPGPIPSASPGVTRDRETANDGRFALGLGLLLAGLIALALVNPRPRIWSDAFYHAAVFREVERGGIPPGYPHFAGQPLSYNWFYQVALVALSRVVHPDPFVLMALVNVWCALLWPLAAYHLARGMSVSVSGAKWAAVAALLGTNPLGIAWLLIRSFVGETQGWDLLLKSISSEGSVQIGLAWKFSIFQATFLGRLWTATAYDFALVLGAAAMLLVQSSFTRLRSGVVLGYGAAMLLLLLWHPLTALQFMIGIAAGCGAVVLSRFLHDSPRDLRSPLWILGATVAAYLLARPYLAMATQGLVPGSIARLSFSLPNAIGLLLSMGPLALAALVSFRTWERRQVLLYGAMGMAMLGVLLFVDVAGIGEEKFFYPLFLLAAAVSGPALEGWWRARGGRRFVLGSVLFASLASLAVTAYGYILDRQPVRMIIDADTPMRADFLSSDEERALGWIREHSPREAVFVQAQRRLGTEPILVFGCRRLYLGLMREFYGAVLHGSSGRPPVSPEVWAELLERERVQAACFSGVALADADLARLRAAPWPVYFWWDSALAGGRLSPTLADTAVTREVFRSPTVRILELRR